MNGWESIHIKEKRFLPEIAAIYSLSLDGENSLYVGSTINLRQRVKGHTIFTEIPRRDEVSIFWTPCEESVLLETEQEWIDLLRPQLNRGPAIWPERDRSKEHNLNLNPFPKDIHKAAKLEALSQRITLKQYIIDCLCRDMGLAIPPAPKSGPKPKEAR